MGVKIFLEMGWWDRIHMLFFCGAGSLLHFVTLSAIYSLLEDRFQYLHWMKRVKSQTFAPFLQRPKRTICHVLKLVTNFKGLGFAEYSVDTQASQSKSEKWWWTRSGFVDWSMFRRPVFVLRTALSKGSLLRICVYKYEIWKTLDVKAQWRNTKT